MKKIILMLPILILSGCAYYQPTAVSTNSIGGKYERPTGIAQGTASRFYFFPCYAACPSGEDSLKAAIDDALIGRNADTLANVFVDRKTTYFPHPLLYLFVRHDVIVTGTLVKYNTDEFPPDDDKFVDIINSKNIEMIFDTLINGEKRERRSLLRNLPDETKSRLHQYLIISENKKQITTASQKDVFLLVAGRPAYLKNKSLFSLQEECYSYGCLISLENKKWEILLKNMDEPEKDAIIKLAKNRIRACFSKKTPSVVVDIEANFFDNEREFLEFLCKSGYLNSK
ncbi:MAG: hypothetical protein L6420_12070 [Elusimicrobia bacterium]|nr:hypothetical protein [Elusimicrobiota bacterium]